MKRLIFIILICIVSLQLSAQNLVPNPSFEDTLACPTNLSGLNGDQIYNLTSWFPAGGSPDYFNSCSATLIQNHFVASVPNNLAGHQYAFHGNAYTGLLTFLVNAPNYGEYLGVNLNSSLQIGVKYYFTARVSSAFGGLGDIYTFANNFGILLSNVHYESSLNSLQPSNSCTAFDTMIISDTTNWTTIKFDFIADSTYSKLYIGNFFDGTHTDTINLFNTSNQGAYLYIDAICLSTDSLTCASIVSLEEIKSKNSITIFPNPTNNLVNIFNPMQERIYLYDSYGQFIQSVIPIGNPTQIDLTLFNAGVYYLKINQSKFYKLIKL